MRIVVFISERKAATSIEYALIGLLISLLVVAGSQAIAARLTEIFTEVSAGLTN